MPKTPLITVNKLHKKFGELSAVKNVSFDVGKGDVLGFLGPNGAGKTTTMRMIVGFLSKTAGEVEICGQKIHTGSTGFQHHIGYLPEGGPLYVEQTAKEALTFIGKIHRLSKRRIEKRLDYVSSVLQLENVLNQPIETLSKGFKRRVALAQAILHDPEILILDEPTDGLDPNQKLYVQGLIKEISSEKAIILSTHILDEVEALCNRAIIISQGQVVASGTPESITTDLDAGKRWVLEAKKPLPKAFIDKTKSLKAVEKIDQRTDHEIHLVGQPGHDHKLELIELIESHKLVVTTFYERPAKLVDAFRKLTCGEK